MASASLIRDKPEDILTRPVTDVDPSPQIGPKFHLERGPEVIVFPRHELQQNDAAVDMFSLTAICISFAIGLLSSIPRFQRVLVMLKLMD